MTEAATRIQRTFRAKKSHKNQHVTKCVSSDESQHMNPQRTVENDDVIV